MHMFGFQVQVDAWVGGKALLTEADVDFLDVFIEVI